MSRVAAALCRFLAPPTDRRTDGALLSAFLRDRDEEAFAELVRRHGPLVWGLCRRALPDPADAEDAFQASFLVLVRRANRLTGQATVGPWLYKVAAWTARNLRRRNARQLARRVALPPDTPDHTPGADAADLAADLDAALLALPEKYRTPLILCHLQGWSRRDAAERLCVPEGTLSALLSRGLSKLRDRLAGHDPVKALGAGSAVVPLVLVAATARAAGAARLALGGTVSASVSQLVEGVLHMFWVQKATAASLGLVVVFGLGLGVGMSVQQAPRATADDTAPAVDAPTPDEVAALTAVEEKLVATLEVTDVDEQETKEKLRAAEEKLKRAAKAFADGQVPAEKLTRDAQDLKQLQDKLAEIEKMRADLKDRIKEVEKKRTTAPRTGGRSAAEPPPTNPADPTAKRPMTRKPEEPKAPPVPPVPPLPRKPAVPPAAANPFRGADTTDPKVADAMKELTARLRELEAMQQKLTADRAKVEAEAQRIRAMAQEQAARERERAARARDTLKEKAADPLPRGSVKEKIAAAGAGGRLEVVVGGADAWWPCWVKEYGADGKAVGSVICDSIPMLSRYLARVSADSKAPHDVRVSTQSGASEDRTKAVLDACKAAGFRNVQVGGRSEITPDGRRDLGILIERSIRGATDVERQHLTERLLKERQEILRDVQRQAERALRDEVRGKEEAIRALEEAQKQLERIKVRPDRTEPEKPKQPSAPKQPTPPRPPKDPDGDDGN